MHFFISVIADSNSQDFACIFRFFPCLALEFQGVFFIFNLLDGFLRGGIYL